LLLSLGIGYTGMSLKQEGIYPGYKRAGGQI